MPSHKRQYSYRHKGWSYPTLDFVCVLHDTSIEEFGGIAGFKDSDRGSGLVASAVETPTKAVGGQDLYPSKFDKVAALAYFIARNHGFNDANKRTALAVAATTLEWNSKYLQWSEETEILIFRLVGFGALSKEGLKYALLDACGYDAKDAQVFENT